jgi:arylsulfatase A-like enzyme
LPTLLIPLLSASACGGGASPAAPAASTPASPAQTASTRAKPHIVFIVADDLDVESISHMPKLQAFMAGVGVTFSNSFASNPVCCPSRATMLRGQYSHNHGVWTNGRGFNSCFSDFRAAGHESSTVATWLKAAGYRTGLVGKYLNRYPASRGGIVDNTYVAPGWDDWFVVYNSEFNSDSYFDYFANDNGKIVTFGKTQADYETDVLAARAVDFIKASAAGGAPMFLWIATTAPHAPSEPAARHLYAYANKFIPRSPNFNEEDMSDKPRWYRENLPLLRPSDIVDIEGTYKRRLETMGAVDDLIEKVLQALDAAGALGSSYLFFTSDNGYMQGPHRFPSGKDAPYEESIRVPLLVRGPGVARATLPHDVSNIDLAPTFAELAQVQAPGFVDGRSLVPLLGGSPTPASNWRQDLLLEHEPVDSNGLPSWSAVRNSREIYVDYPAVSEEEYYDLINDPYQLDSKHRALDGARKAQLRARLRQLQECAGASCRANP